LSNSIKYNTYDATNSKSTYTYQNVKDKNSAVTEATEHFDRLAAMQDYHILSFQQQDAKIGRPMKSRAEAV